MACLPCASVGYVASSAGHSAEVTFEKCKGVLSARGKVDGSVLGSDGQLLFSLSGSVLSSIQATPQSPEAAAAVDGQVGTALTVFSRPPDVPEAVAQYNMSRFAIGLNDPRDPLAHLAAPTDSRWRPDMRHLENAEYERATKAKLWLEDRQRRAAVSRKATEQPYRAKWFDWEGTAEDTEGKGLVKHEGLLPHLWRFNEQYWKAREAGSWTLEPDIFGNLDAESDMA
jgi:oxysterol-binding protein 1